MDNINNTDNQSTVAEPIAALACTLTGGYLIEASAGTGKTWTLTGIILRILIEKKYPPERIIATTFTRAAAAEMQERVAARLSDFYQLLRYVKAQAVQKPEWFIPFNQPDGRGYIADENHHDGSADDMQAKLDAVLDDISKAATAQGLAADDLINRHLLAQLLIAGMDDIDAALYRLAQLMSSLDKLFVGTLDSLAQKWLHEFSAQIGHDTSSEIIHEGQYVKDLIHDALRAEESTLKATHPDIYAIITAKYPAIFADSDQMVGDINNALQFFTAPINTTGFQLPDMAALEAERLSLLMADWSAFAPYYDRDFARSEGIDKRAGRLGTHIERLDELLARLADGGLLASLSIHKDFTKFAERLAGLGNDNDFLKAATDESRARFMALPWQQVQRVFDLVTSIATLADDYLANLRCRIALAVREKLPARLERLGKTTFTLQMQRLNNALENNPALATHIRHHYPVALIDESQDINGAQVKLIRHVYLDAYHDYQQALASYDKLQADSMGVNKPKAPKGFLLLVGDPKQAIYRFRGGDVSNYNLVKHFGGDTPVLNSTLSLNVNYRSNKALIDALNVWFSQTVADGYANHAYLGTGIYYQPISAVQAAQAPSWQNAAAADKLPSYLGKRPLAVLHIDYADKACESELIAKHINSLIQNGYSLTDAKSGIARKIRPADIAVLSRAKKDLAALKAALDTLAIPSVAATEINVFSTQAGQDIYALLMAVMHPSHTEHLARLLVSRLFGLSLDESLKMLGSTDNLADDGLADDFNDASDGADNGRKLALTQFLKAVYDDWQRYTLSAALSDVLSRTPWDGLPSLWLQAAAQGERYLGDLQQILALIGEQDNLHAQKLIAWYQTQMISDAKDLPEDYHRNPLKSDVGVSLMTIHKSKGLEFPIVYVMGLDSAPSPKQKPVMYPYSDKNYERKISAVAVGDDGTDYAAMDEAETVDELRRLGYVALTRASEQLFVVATDAGTSAGDDKKPLAQWFGGIDKGKFTPAERLADTIDWISLYADDADADADRQPLALNNSAFKIDTASDTLLPQPDWDKLITQKSFMAAKKTSFTALIRGLSQKDNAIHPADDEIEVTADVMVAESLPADIEHLADAPDIRTSFMRGAAAGEFLHQLLELIWDDADISRLVDERALRLGMPVALMSQHAQALQYQRQGITPTQMISDEMHLSLCAWLTSIRHAPFAASKRSLVSLEKAVQTRELGFTLGLSKYFSIAALNDAFLKYSDVPLMLDEQDKNWYQYLRGEIDLVYEAGGRFYVLDYKSNYLGEHISDYHPKALTDAMHHAGYWLQAAIYQVALHRLLRVRLADYTGHEADYLGAVEYLFIRGVADGQLDYGRLVWQPPLALVLALDQLFSGQAV